MRSSIRGKHWKSKMNETTKTAAGHLFGGVMEGLIMSLLNATRKTVEEKGEEFLKAKFGNRGTNDEYLFVSACTVALSGKMISRKNLLRVCAVINSYSSDQRSRIVGIIGKTETEKTVERDRLDKDGNVMMDGKGNPLKEKVVEKGNHQGAEIIAMLGKMPDDEIHNYFAASGVSVTTGSDLRKSAKEIKDKIESSQLKADGDSFFSRPSALEKFCNSIGVTI